MGIVVKMKLRWGTSAGMQTWARKRMGVDQVLETKVGIQWLDKIV